MSEYKIVASDLDGTLLNSSSEISEENIKAINTLIDNGVCFVPCTGRTYSEIPLEIKNISGIRYFIHSNGSVVYDRVSDERILNCLSNSDCRKILDIVKKYETHITFRKDGECYVDSRYQDKKSQDYYNVCEEHRVVVRNFSVFLDDFENISYNADNVEAFAVFFKNLSDKFECKKLLETNENLRIVEVSEYNLEIVNADAGKGNALYALADKLGVEHNATISLGDSDNDRSITQAAGLGLAVSNACDALKAVADKIICSNDEHAMKYVVENFFTFK